MSRNSAKLLTLTGIVCVLVSVILPIYGYAVKMKISLIIAALMFIAGIVLITSSLAYYTEK